METKLTEFLNKHSRRYLEMALSQQRRQRIEHPDGYGNRTGACGDTVEMFLDIRDDRIFRTCFDTDGCLNTNACANTVARLSEGRRISQAWEITADEVIAYLESLPPEEHHCAELAVGAFYLALSAYEKYRRAPWKKVYRK